MLKQFQKKPCFKASVASKVFSVTSLCLTSLCLVSYALTSSVIATQAFADAAKKATVNVTAEKGKNPGTFSVQFKTIAGNGLKINAEGPWKLDIKSATGLKFEKSEFKRDAWIESAAGFTALGTNVGKAATADITYKLTAFVCTADKSMCYREVVENQATVKLPN